MPQKIAYIMSRFPHLPETFILREMIALEAQGWTISLYPLILQQQSIIHPEAEAWIPRAKPLPFASPAVLMANGQTVVNSPGRYNRTLGRTIWESRTNLNLLIRAIALFPKAVYAARLMQQEGITHIHAHYATHPALVAWIIHQLTGIKYSIAVHAHDIFVRTAMLPTKLRDAAFIVSISEFNRDYLSDLVGSWVYSKIHVVRCGIPVENYLPNAVLADRTGPFEIISTGSLQPYKGYPYLIKACALLKEKGVPFRCRIIGGGEERTELERLIAAEGLESKVELLGPQPQKEVARLLSTAHCYTQPSIITPSGKMEGLPSALTEALASGLPAVATSISGIPEMIRPGETGYLVPPANAAALAEALNRVYVETAEAVRLAEAGRALVLREFDLKENIKQLDSLFSRLIAPGQAIKA